MLASFLLLNAVAGLSVGVAHVILSLYAVELKANAMQLGLIGGVQSLGLLLMSLPAGVLVDQYGPVRLFRIGTLASGALYLLVPQVHSPLLLCSLMLAIGCFMPLRIVSLSAVFMQQIGRLGVSIAGWFRATHMGGMVLLGPLVAGWLVEVVGFAAGFWIIGIAFFVLVLLATDVLSQYQPSQEHRRRLTFAELRAQLALLGSHALLRRVCIREFCTQAVGQFYGFFIVAIAINHFGFEASTAASLISLHGASYVFALLCLGALAACLETRTFLRAACLLVVAALAALGWAQAGWVLWCATLVLGLGMGMIQIVNITLLAKVGEQVGQGRIAGLTMFVGPAGGLSGSLLGGALGSVLGLQAVFLLLAPLFALFLFFEKDDPR